MGASLSPPSLLFHLSQDPSPPPTQTPLPPSLLTHGPLLFLTQRTLQKATIKQTLLLVSLRSGTAQRLRGIYTHRV